MPIVRVFTDKVKQKVRDGDIFYPWLNILRRGMATKLGDKIRELRKKHGLTLEKLALKAGLSKSYLWELENRDSQRPSAEKLSALADVLGVSSAYFLEDDVREPEERHMDEAFYRNYQQLDTPSKERLRLILDTFKNKP
jgi:transcriptional regulator with XRE-family HTH domain